MDLFANSKSRSKSRSKSNASRSRSKSRSKSNASNNSRSKSKSRSKSNASNNSKSRSKSRSKSYTKHTTPENISVKVYSNSPKKVEEIVLQFPEPLPDKIDYNANVAKKMNKLFQMHEKVEPFLGNYFFENIFYLYLFKKYRMHCTWRGDLDIFMNLEIVINIDDKNHINPNEKSIHNLVRCICEAKSKIIIIPVALQIQVANSPPLGHANLLIYRKNTSELEHFEPHGDKFRGDNSSKVNSKIKHFLDTFVEKVNISIELNNEEDEYDAYIEGNDFIPAQPIRLVRADQVCPRQLGVQSLEANSTIPINVAIEPEGYCSAWSMFFTELCLKNPEIPSRQIYEAIMKKTELYSNQNDYLRNVIRGYTCFINNKLAKHYSDIFDEPITSAKVHALAISNNRVINPPEQDVRNYFDKLMKIMEFEHHVKLSKFEHHSKSKQKKKFKKFVSNIKKTTSSSELKSEDRIPSPKRTSSSRKIAKSKTAKK